MYPHRMRLLLAATVAAVAFSAVASAWASAAPNWKVGGVELGSGVTKPIKFANTTTGKLKVPAISLTLNCTGSTGKGTITGGSPGTDSITELKFTGCTVEGAATCKVTVATEGLPYATKLVEEGGVVYDEVSGIKVKVVITGCAAESTNTVTGTARAKVGNPGKLEFTATSGSDLLLGKHPAELIVSYLVEGESGETIEVT